MTAPTSPTGNVVKVPTDPFLWAHEIRPGIFDIATGLRPASVRDQITRARLLMRRAFDTGILGRGSRIAISGAGIAGATCAIEAAVKYRVRVLLVEQAPFPFILQRRCITRSVDPNLYDWPGAQWQNRAYPVELGDHVPFGFRAYERPRDVARRWTRFLESAARATGGLLDIRYRTKFVSMTDDLDANKEHEVRLSDGTSIKARMVVIAEGPGEERDTLRSTAGQPFYGYRFWDTDPFLHDPIRAQRVVIAGSGDGALQDVLRLVLRPEISLRRLLQKCALPPEYLARIQTCRQHNIAAFLWCANQEHEHENDLFVHRLHQELVETLLASRARKQILRTINDSLRTHVPEIVLAHACAHFTHGYPLNRFLTLLVVRALEELGREHVHILPNSFVTAVNCNHDTITYAPGEERRRRLRKYCYAQPHEVFLGRGQCYDPPPRPSPQDRREECDAVIIRFGVKEDVPEGYRDREKPLRQLLPTHLAHQG